MRSLLALMILSFALLLPVSAWAQGQLVPAPCTPGVGSCPTNAVSEASRYGTCEFVSLINNVVSFIVLFASIAATIVIIYAGFRLLTSGGDVSAKTAAKGTITNVIIGYVIVLSAFLIINTLVSMLVVDNDKLINFQEIECIYPNVPKEVKYKDYTDAEYAEMIKTNVGGSTGEGFEGGGGSTTGGGYAGGGGSCAVSNSGNCAVSRLGCFGDKAEAASKVCNIESGGNSAARSSTDLCKGGESFSGGLFQINILANNRYLNNCSSNFFTKNGSSAQGDCLRSVTNSGGVSYCQIRDCSITNTVMYNSCMNQTYNPSINLRVACQLFDASGQDFDPWITSARRCGVQ